jgi:outer membrane protein OmpA-like peptidoglycan-associated protein
MTKKIFYTLLYATVFITTAIAQERDGYEALAEKRFALFQYSYAIPVFEKLVTQKKPKPYWLYQLAYCYEATDNYKNAATWYTKFLAVDTANNKELYVKIGDLYKTIEQYDSALMYYNEYSNKFGNVNRIQQRIVGCKKAIEWINNPTKHIIANVEALNTRFSDWGATYGNNDSIVFMSDFTRETIINDKKSINPSNYKWNGNSFYKIYVANNKAFNSNDWYEASMMNTISSTINKSNLHIGPIVFSKNFDTAYYTQTYDEHVSKKELALFNSRLRIGSRRLELFQIIRSNNVWQTPKKLSFNNKSQYNVGHAALTNDGNTMYFTSDMPGGFGKTDIWFSKKNADGTWGAATNCGATINTEDEEAYPTINNNTLYFASTGNIGMGGFDIFMANGAFNNFNSPINLQHPINTAQDDFYFIIHSYQQKGLLSSNRKKGYGSDDIYSFISPKEKIKELEKIVPQNPTIAVRVKNKITNQYIDGAYITLQQQGFQQEYKQISSVDSANYFTVYSNTKYQIQANKINEGTDSTTVTSNSTGDTLFATLYISPKQQVGNNNMEEMIQRFTGLKQLPPKTGDKFKLKNLYYNLDKYNIRNDAAVILDTLVLIMNYYPTLQIELSSHTDSRASSNYNNILSNNRAKAAVEYLVSKGISKSRMIAKGYGETKLVNKCADGIKCTEAEHQQNRRTEVMVTKF